MGVERQIPEQDVSEEVEQVKSVIEGLQENGKYYRMRIFERVLARLERIADHAAEVERLTAPVSDEEFNVVYKTKMPPDCKNWFSWALGMILANRKALGTDQQLQPKGEQEVKPCIHNGSAD